MDFVESKVDYSVQNRNVNGVSERKLQVADASSGDHIGFHCDHVWRLPDSHLVPTRDRFSKKSKHSLSRK